MIRLSLILILLSTLSYSCSKDEIKIDPDNLLIGVWNYSTFQDNTIVYTRNQNFADVNCYKFNTDGSLVERKNSGFCGTPPISYANYTGSWTMVNDTLVKINVGYWGGTMTYKLDIEFLDSNTLKIISLPE
jgi:hypothetical protein